MGLAVSQLVKEGTMARLGIGIDIGGSGIKGALVDLDKGEFASDRIRYETPSASTPEAVAAICARIVDELDAPDDIPVGVTMPAPIVHGRTPFIANLDQSWVDCDVDELFTDALGRDVVVFNDADAAGVAESAFGAAKGVKGTVIVTTLGTGIGTALLYDEVLVPNTELGHLELDGHDAETMASARQRRKQNLSWEEWAKRLTRYYSHLEMLFSPDLIVVGGGVSKRHEEFFPLLDLVAPIVPAELRNTAGIVGAAYYADQVRRKHLEV